MASTGPRVLVVASASQGAGKSAVAAALAVSFRGLGLQTLALRVVPGLPEADHGMLESATGKEVLPLNPWLLGGSPEKLQAFIQKHAQGCDVVIIDGSMGLHTPMPLLQQACPACSTTCHVAIALKAHTLLVLEASQPLTSLISAAKVSLETCPGLQAPCLLLNQADSNCPFTPSSLHAALQAAGLPMRLIGCIPILRGVPTDSLPAVMRRHIDVDALLHACPPARHVASPSLKRFLGALPGHLGSGGGGAVQAPALASPHGAPRAVIAVAVDEAFGPTYPGDLAALEAEGATLVRFSPIHDSALPRSCQGVLLGGGGDAMAMHVRALAANAPMRSALRAFSEAGGAVLAQAAGVVYLASACSAEGSHDQLPMVGVFPFRAALHPASWPPSQGYVELTLTTAAKHLLTHPATARTAGTGTGSHAVRALLHSRADLVEERTHRLGPWGGPPAAFGGAGPAPQACRPYSTAFMAVAAGAGRVGTGDGTDGSSSPLSPAGSGGHNNGQQQAWAAGYCLDNVLASTIHWPLNTTPEMVHAWVGLCGRVDAAAVHAAAAAAVTATAAVQAPPAAGSGKAAQAAGALDSSSSKTTTLDMVSMKGEMLQTLPSGKSDSCGQLLLLPGGQGTIPVGPVEVPAADAKNLVGQAREALGGEAGGTREGKANTCSSVQLPVDWDRPSHTRTASVLSDLGPAPTPALAPCAPRATTEPSKDATLHAQSVAAAQPPRPVAVLSPPPAPAATCHPLHQPGPIVLPPGVPRASMDSRLTAQATNTFRPYTTVSVRPFSSGSTGGPCPSGPASTHATPQHSQAGSASAHPAAPTYPMPRHGSQPTLSANSSPGPGMGAAWHRNGGVAGADLRSQLLGGGGGGGWNNGAGGAMSRPTSCMELAGSGAASERPPRRSLCDWQQLQAWGYDANRSRRQQQQQQGGGGAGHPPLAPRRGGTQDSCGAGHWDGPGGDAAVLTTLVDAALGLPALAQLSSATAGCGTARNSGPGKLIGLACPLRPGSAPAAAMRPPTSGAQAPPAHSCVHSIQECEEGSGPTSTAGSFLGPYRQPMSRVASTTWSTGAGGGGAGRASCDVGALAWAGQAAQAQPGFCPPAPLSAAPNTRIHSRSASSGSLTAEPNQLNHQGGVGRHSYQHATAPSPYMLSSSGAGGSLSGFPMQGGAGGPQGGGGMVGGGSPFWLPSPPVCSDGIVSLCPGATEVLAAMGLAGRLVGVTDACDWPPHLRSVTPLACRNRASLLMAGPHAGAWGAGGMEGDGHAQLVVDEDLLRDERPSLVVLPDLALLPLPDQRALTRALQRTVIIPSQPNGPAGSAGANGGVNGGALVLVHAGRTLAEVVEAVLKLGDAAGAPQAAGSLADRLRARLRRVATCSAGLTAGAGSGAWPVVAGGAAGGGTGVGAAAPRVLVVTGLRADGGAVRVGGWVPEMLALAGARQAVVGAGAAGCAAHDGGKRTQANAHLQVALEPGEEGYPITWEDLVSFAPDILVIAHRGASGGGGGAAGGMAAVAGLASKPGWWSLPSVRQGAVYLVDEPLVTRAGPRLVDGVEVLANIVHHHHHHHHGSQPPGSTTSSSGSSCPASTAALQAQQASGLARVPSGAVLKLSLCGGQRCRPSLLPNYFLPWPPGSATAASSQQLLNMWAL